MANPAELLHEQLSRWNIKTGQVTARSLDTEDGWIEQRQAVKNLEHLDELLDELKQLGKPVDVEREYFGSWLYAVFSFPHGWSSGNLPLDGDSLNVLRLAGHRFSDVVLPVQEGATADMLVAADELEESLKEKAVPPALQMLVAESIGFLRNSVLQYEVTGEFVLNKAVKKFVQVLELLEETLPGETVAARLKFRVRRWYKASPVQMALAGLISAQMALAAPVINEQAEIAATSVVDSVAEAFEKPAALEPPSAELTEGDPAEDTDE